jgi:hypothetical protein
VRLSHVVLNFPEPEKMRAWYPTPMNEWVSKQMFNDPDKGLFAAPPV